MKIRAGPNLELKHDWKLRSRAATLLAASHTLSSSGFHKHLEMLTTLMERSTNPSRGRTLFEAFLWRASVMQPPHLPVVVAPGTSHIIPTAAAPAEPNSFITASLECQEYTAYIARGTENAKCIRSGSSPHTGDKLESKVRMFLVDSGNSQLRDCTPYIVSSLHASGDGYIRGVLSNGFEYIFIELLRNENNEGATYRVSGSFTFQIQPSSLLGETADEISGVLASWFLNSKEPTSASSDDWLSPCIGIGDAD
ncbi:hypothetical protein BXZ70DRAFT_229269 [Cristinia sonorae]|uniref:Uncharacterized protein n=1 Tax=Cristinia sonorae TaxID=1940300 RepID=A0A8K0XNZ0_9AGAR|nr:hypothetical protein BXZ70DRAFT_229269 [Cristinia sonorae]